MQAEAIRERFQLLVALVALGQIEQHVVEQVGEFIVGHLLNTVLQPTKVDYAFVRARETEVIRHHHLESFSMPHFGIPNQQVDEMPTQRWRDTRFTRPGEVAPRRRRIAWDQL